MKIRQIVKDALKCDALIYQFSVIDIEDKILVDASDEEINEKFDDAYIIGEAENQLDICMNPLNQDDPDYCREEKQLRKFLAKYK